MFGQRRFRGYFMGFFSIATAVGAGSCAAAAVPEPLAEAAAARNSLEGWNSWPVGTVTADHAVRYEGAPSIHFRRDKLSRDEFSGISRSIPVNFSGRKIELRGHLRTENVSKFAGLWLRLDNGVQPVEFDNMESRHLGGTTDWAEYTIELPLNPKATTLVYGALLVGSGEIWCDAPRLFVDGKPIAEAERKKTVIDADREFDKGSEVHLDGLTSRQIDSLVLTGKVWGFLKYFHPAITTGTRQWDYELFRWLPRILGASKPEETRRLLADWVDSLGPISPCDPCVEQMPAGTVQLSSPTAWIHDEAALGQRLSVRLVDVYRNRRPATQFYVSLASDVGNPVFQNEPAYEQMTLPDAGLQILAAYRFWAIAQYWFPYRDLIAGNWDAALRENIVGVAQAPGGDAFDRALLKLIARVGDTHANLWSSLSARPPQGDCALPAAIRFVEDRAVIAEVAAAPAPDPMALPLTLPSGGKIESTPTVASNLQRGDVVKRLDGVAVGDLVARWSPYFADSNDAARKRDMGSVMTRGACGEMNLDVDRDGRALQIVAQRVPMRSIQIKRSHDLPGDTFRLLSAQVAYLKLSSIKSADVAGYIEAAQNTKGLIVDLRNYPSEFVVFSLGNLLVDAETPFVRFTTSGLSDPGVFRWGGQVGLKPSAPHYSGKVVVLVDEVSQSQAEYTAMALRASPRAIVVGSTTAGADGNVSPISLPGRRSAMISGLGVFYPDKRPTQQVGIVPDIVVKPTIRGIREGFDEILERALREILGADLNEGTLRNMYR